MNKIISTHELTKYYDPKTCALNKVTLSINEGEWTTIMGPSGSGKTTLLNMIGSLDSPTGGKVIVDDIDITKLTRKRLTKFRREKIGFIFQQYHLIPYLTVLENVMLAQYYYGSVDERYAREVLERLGLGHRAEHIPAHLSGGEQQRACIARALVNEPKILLADEPTGNLDQKNGENILEILKELNEDGHTIVLITHNLDIARCGNRIIKLVDGKIFADTAEELKKTPEPLVTLDIAEHITKRKEEEKGV